MAHLALLDEARKRTAWLNGPFANPSITLMGIPYESLRKKVRPARQWV